MLAKTGVKRRQGIEAGGKGQFIDAQGDGCGLQGRQQVPQPSLIDVAVEALPQHLIEQIGNLVAAVATRLRYPLQVKSRFKIGLLMFEILLQILRHEAQLTG
ncbi:hypothetical protein D3C73_1296870 [compost metagenome]